MSVKSASGCEGLPCLILLHPLSFTDLPINKSFAILTVYQFLLPKGPKHKDFRVACAQDLKRNIKLPYFPSNHAQYNSSSALLSMSHLYHFIFAGWFGGFFFPFFLLLYRGAAIRIAWK